MNAEQALEAVGADIKRLTDTAFLVIKGSGRPDQPDTTNGKITGNEPDGTEFHSLNGAGVGAWKWAKQDGSWQVIDGDTGWRAIESAALHQGKLFFRRTAQANYVTAGGGPWGTITLRDSVPVPSRDIRLLTNNGIPDGWRTPVAILAPVTKDGFELAGTLLLSSTDDGNFLGIRGNPRNDRNLIRLPMLVYPPADAWCSRLPEQAVSL